MKKAIKYLLLPMLLTVVVGCNNNNNSTPDSQPVVSDEKFESKTFIADGTEKVLLHGGLKPGQRAEYENNKATEQGKYKATCRVYDENNNLVETLYAIMTIDNPDNVVFDYYLDSMFSAFLGNDYVSWNVFASNPENFNLIRNPLDKAHWYTYTSIEEGDKLDSYNGMVALKNELQRFKSEPLSYNQLISYTALEEFVNENIEYYDPNNIYDEMTNLRYVDSFGGYAADFVTYVEAYSFRTEQDIIDILDYTASLPDAFATYPTYVQDRLDAGYPLSDYTLNEMISYLDNVTKAEEDYYLVDYVQEKIDGCDYLSDAKKGEYKDKVEQHFTDYFFPAHKDLATSLASYKGKCTGNLGGYLTAYGDVGKAEYSYQLRSNLGMPNLDMDAFEAYLDENIEEYKVKLNAAVNKANRLTSAQYSVFNNLQNIGKSAVGINEPEEMIPFLKEFAKTIVPDLKMEPEIHIKYMDKASAENSNALAYYMKSALDNDKHEYITLNPLTSLTNANDTMATMAHEGYPGHMYAYMYSKELEISNLAKILSNLTHGEGWATYVELKLFEYIKENHKYPNAKNAVNAYCDYMFAQDALTYLANTKIDHMIHYKNEGIGAVSAFLTSLGFNGGAAQDIYNTLIEMPGNYAAYGFGRIFFLDLHLDAQEKLGEFYNEIDFNAALLSHGWCSGDELVKIQKEYIDHTAFLNGLTLEENA